MQDHPPPQTLLGIKAPSSYVDTNMYMSWSWTELQPRVSRALEKILYYFQGHTHTEFLFESWICL